jgi:hypothetical protein
MDDLAHSMNERKQYLATVFKASEIVWPFDPEKDSEEFDASQTAKKKIEKLILSLAWCDRLGSGLKVEMKAVFMRK